jgi:hypothetical protein
MNKVILTSQVGADGVLNVTVPLQPEDANKTVRVTVEVVDQAAPPPRQPRRPGTLRGTVLYMAPDFDAPLEDFKEYME